MYWDFFTFTEIVNPMKTKILYIILGVAFLTSCTSKKPVVKEVAPGVSEGVVAVGPTIQMDGKKLFEQSFVNCHKLYKPSDFNAEQWKPIMARMQKKARLNDGEALAIYTYLTTTPQ